MVGAVDELGLDVDHREAGERSRTQDRLDALLNARDVFLRHRTADDLGVEGEALADLCRLEHHLDAGELARTARLLLVGVIDFRTTRDRLAIGDLRGADIRLDLVLATHTVDEDVEMQFTHAGDDRLAALFVGLDAEGRILGSEAVEREAHLFLVALGLRLDRDLDDRIGEFHALQDDRLQRVAERVARGDVLEACQSDDVAGKRLIDVFTRVRMHLEHAAQTLLLVLHRVLQRGALRDLARIDAAEGERTDEWIVHDLEGKHRKRLVVGRLAHSLLLGLRIDALDRRHFDRRRQELDDRVEQRLDALVLEGRTAENRREPDVAGALADEATQLLVLGHHALEVTLHRAFVDFDGGFDHQVAVLRGLFLQIVRDLHDVPLGAERLVAPDQRVHLDQVDDPLEFVLGTDRQLDDDRTRAEAGLDHVDAAVEIGARLVHLVDEDHARDMILVGLAPNSLSLRLDAGIGVEEGDGAVEDAQRTLDLNGEVDVARRIDDVEAALLAVAAFPIGRGRG